jgi:hypothetical protein
MLVKQNELPKQALNIFLFSSQPCESTFKNARALSGVYRTAVNFTVADFLYRSEKLSILNEAKCYDGLHENDQELKFSIHHKKRKQTYDFLSNLDNIDQIQVEYVISAAFNHAKELVSNLNISTLLKKCNCFEINSLSEDIFNNIISNINPNNYFLDETSLPSDSECKSDDEDEAIQFDEVDNDLFDGDEEDEDVTRTPGVDEIKTNGMNFNGIRIFDTINPAL